MRHICNIVHPFHFAHGFPSLALLAALVLGGTMISGSQLRGEDPMILPEITTSLLPRTSIHTTENVPPDTVYAGMIPAATCDSVDIPFVNAGPKPVRIDSMYFAGGDTENFSIEIPSSGKVDEIGVGASAVITIRFCPSGDRCFSTSLYMVVRTIDGSAPPRLYRTGIGGCAGTPRLVIDDGEIDFGDVFAGECAADTVVFRNDGTYPVKVDAFRPLRQIFRIEPAELAAGFTLLAGEARNVIISFCPDAAGEFADTIDITSTSADAVPSLHLRGRAFTREVELPDTIRFGRVRIRECRDTILVIRNGGSSPVTAAPAMPDNPAFPLSPPDMQRTVSPGDTVHLHVRFCPRMMGQTFGHLDITIGADPPRSVVLSGEGIAPRIRLDTASARAGDLLYLRARLDSTSQAAIPIGNYVLRLRLNPAALFPRQVIAVPGTAGATMTYDADGTVSIEGDGGGSSLPDGTLVLIELRGLSTGNPANRVLIEQATIDGIGMLQPDGEGLVMLDGCDVEYGVQVMSRLAIKAARMEPGGSAIAITYSAPAGTLPLLRIFDLSGRIVHAIHPGEGTGAAQNFIATTGRLYRGVYVVELSTEGARAVAPVAVTE